MAYEYKVVPAPAKGIKAKGVKGAEARFAQAMEQLMNDMAADGWDFQRSETLPSEERSGLTSSQTVWRNLLVFRRPATGGHTPTPPDDPANDTPDDDQPDDSPEDPEAKTAEQADHNPEDRTRAASTPAPDHSTTLQRAAETTGTGSGTGTPDEAPELPEKQPVRPQDAAPAAAESAQSSAPDMPQPALPETDPAPQKTPLRLFNDNGVEETEDLAGSSTILKQRAQRLRDDTA